MTDLKRYNHVRVKDNHFKLEGYVLEIDPSEGICKIAIIDPDSLKPIWEPANNASVVREVLCRQTTGSRKGKLIKAKYRLDQLETVWHADKRTYERAYSRKAKKSALSQLILNEVASALVQDTSPEDSSDIPRPKQTIARVSAKNDATRPKKQKKAKIIKEKVTESFAASQRRLLLPGKGTLPKKHRD